MKKVNQSLKTLAGLAGPEKFQDLSVLYERMRSIRVSDNTCNCGDETSGKYFCGNKHSLCSPCALGSCRIGKCFYCEDKNVAFDFSSEKYTCCKCNQSYDSMYFISLECKCVYCTNCGYQAIITNKYCSTHYSKQIEDSIIHSIYQYMQRIWGYS